MLDSVTKYIYYDQIYLSINVSSRNKTSPYLFRSSLLPHPYSIQLQGTKPRFFSRSQRNEPFAFKSAPRLKKTQALLEASLNLVDLYGMRFLGKWVCMELKRKAIRTNK